MEGQVEKDESQLTVVAQSSQAVQQSYRIVRFKHRPMIEQPIPYPHFIPLHKEQFDKLAYPILGGVSRSRISDVYAYLCSTAEDLSKNEHLLSFGIPLLERPIEADTPLEFHVKNPPAVWDMDELAWRSEIDQSACVWRSPYQPLNRSNTAPSERLPFIMSLAGQDEGVYDDIMQSIAPLVMKQKPDGIIWWVGNGANGKSTLMDALYRVFPNAFASITVRRLIDGRDTPSLNGVLANVVKESSEGRVDDSEVYKSLGTHENFRVHKFHSQDDIEINGNLHTIFSANAIPSFSDKGYSMRRRTFIIPFMQQFQSNPDFEGDTFTPLFFGQLINEMCRYARILKSQGYRYKWSATTLAAKLEYDAEASNAEEYAKAIIDEGVVSFLSFNPVRIDYENWCADNGYVPLGIGNLRKALTVLGFERITKRNDRGYTKFYRLKNIDNNAEFEAISMGRPGLFTVVGFRRAADPVVPEFKEPATGTTPKRSILNGKW